MRYLSVAEMAKKWDVSERSVRNYCAHGRVPGAFITGKTWNIPENAKKPELAPHHAAPDGQGCGFYSRHGPFRMCSVS